MPTFLKKMDQMSSNDILKSLNGDFDNNSLSGQGAIESITPDTTRSGDVDKIFRSAPENSSLNISGLGDF